MFNMKLISDKGSYTCIRCCHYDVSVLESGIVEVIMYEDFTNNDGVTYRVGEIKDAPEHIAIFHTCFVMNDKGYVLDKISK